MNSTDGSKIKSKQKKVKQFLFKSIFRIQPSHLWTYNGKFGEIQLNVFVAHKYVIT